MSCNWYCSLLNGPPIKTEYQQEAIHTERRMNKIVMVLSTLLSLSMVQNTK